MKRLILTNAQVVAPDRVYLGTVIMTNGMIENAGPGIVRSSGAVSGTP